MPSTDKEIHVGDIGTVFLITVSDDDGIVDISDADQLKFIFRKPDGTVMTKDGVFSTDGTDGKMQYISQENDLDQAGKWRLQGFIGILNSPSQWYTNITKFKVFVNIG